MTRLASQIGGAAERSARHGKLAGVPDEAHVPALAPAASDAPAQWLTPRIATFGPSWVTSTAGTDWEAYCRLFHPLDDSPNAPRWADIAKTHGHTMHAGAQWHVTNSRAARIGFVLWV